jgi:ligand-binding sensor protein
MHNHKKYGKLCDRCHAHGGLHATMEEKPYIYRCHGGLVEFAVPLMVDGKYVGAIMGGQCEPVGEYPDLAPVLHQTTRWQEDPELTEACRSIHKANYEKLEAAIRLVQDILQHLLEEEHTRLVQEELNRKNRELMEEKNARVNMEIALKEEEESGAVVDRLDQDHLFFVLNVISRLAFLEKAEETERTVCDFAAMMRYVLENGEYNCVTLGEELEYIDNYLQIQRRRMEGRLRFEIAVPETYLSTLCPFMLLHPLAQNTVRYILDNSRDGGSISIRGWEENDHLVLSICCDCVGLIGQRAGRVLAMEERRQGSGLVRADQSLKNVFGPACGITTRNREDGLQGMEIQVRLPLSGGSLEK